jgi:hypothetical protein
MRLWLNSGSVYRPAHTAARLEVQCVSSRNRDGLAGLWIAAESGLSVADREYTEAANFNPLARRESIGERPQQALHTKRHIRGDKVRLSALNLSYQL